MSYHKGGVYFPRLYSPQKALGFDVRTSGVLVSTHVQIDRFIVFFHSLSYLKNMTNLRGTYILAWGLMTKSLNLYLNFLA